ncbi:MAG: ATP-binding protein [Myxococcota bacterium]
MENWYRIQAALLAAVVCTTLAIAVLLRSRRNLPSGRFATLAFNLVAWFVVDALMLSELIGVRTGSALSGIVAGAMPTTLIGFFAAFAADDDRLTHAAVLLGRVLSGLALATSAVLWATSDAFADPDLHLEALRGVETFAGVSIVAALVLSVLLMVRRTSQVELRSERTRLTALSWASAAVFGAALAAYTFDVGVAWLGNMLPAVFMFFIYQVITLRRILDVFEFIGRVVVLAGFAIVLSAIYALLVSWWRHDFGLFIFNTVIATIVILILLEPLRTFVEVRLNELIFREKYEFTRAAELTRSSLANVIDVGAMTDLLMSRLAASRQVTHASVYLRDEEGLAFNRLGFVGTAPPASLDAITARPYLARLLQQRVLTIETLENERETMVEKGSVEDQSRFELTEAALAQMRELEAQVVVAFESFQMAGGGEAGGRDEEPPAAGFTGGGVRLLGFLCVKNERLREAWSAEELRALAAIAAQAVITIENSRLFDRIRERDRLAAIGQMAAGLAHEIRNPLGAIKGSAQLIGEVDPEQRATFLQIITEEVNRLDSVVSQFLTYARPLKGKRELVDVNQVLERTLTLVAAEQHSSPVELVPASGLPAIRSDPELIRQVTLNLCRNGIEAMASRGGGKMTISTALVWRTAGERREGKAAGTAEPGSYVRIRFEDEGPGIPPEVMERLFIPFYTTKPQGTGLGLAICQRIVESLGGTIEVSSRVGRGATFSVFLPVADASARTTTA